MGEIRIKIWTIGVSILWLSVLDSSLECVTTRADNLSSTGKKTTLSSDTVGDFPIAISQDDWPWWRGPDSNNHSNMGQPPLKWSNTDGVVWKVAIPGRGHASPCIVGKRIFISRADEESEIQFLVCYDRASGKRLWRTDLKRGGFMQPNMKNSHASATPACDGRYVYVPLMNGGDMWVIAVDMHGGLVWEHRIGEYKNSIGYAPSPVLFENLVVVASDNEADSVLVGLERATGRVVWQTDRPSVPNAASPVVAHVAGRSQILINGAYLMASYDPMTGRMLWHVNHATEVAACTAVWSDAHVISSGNHPVQDMLCVRADGQGDVTETHVTWRDHKANTYVPSPVVSGQLVFVVIDSGVAYCRHLESGKVLWKQRLSGAFSASPVLADGHLYVTDEKGTTFVVNAEEEFQLIAKNKIPEPTFATLAICGTRIYLRTLHHLYCISR